MLGVIALEGGEVVLVVDGFFHDPILENVRSLGNRQEILPIRKPRNPKMGCGEVGWRKGSARARVTK